MISYSRRRRQQRHRATSTGNGPGFCSIYKVAIFVHYRWSRCSLFIIGKIDCIFSSWFSRIGVCRLEMKTAADQIIDCRSLNFTWGLGRCKIHCGCNMFGCVCVQNCMNSKWLTCRPTRIACLIFKNNTCWPARLVDAFSYPILIRVSYL